MVYNFKSQSPLFHSIIEKIDDTLATIPTEDQEGCDIEDSLYYESYVSALENVSAKDETGRFHYPLDKTLAMTLLQDEMKARRETNNERII
tara:strand:- start:265 stop:537 length:273 start_codon:yes stop_codon:yes gene_type:complete